jgi:hypothetical protein
VKNAPRERSHKLVIRSGRWEEIDVAVDQLKREIETYDANHDALLGSALNKYVLIHGTEIVGTYDTESDAINDGYRRFGNVPFLVKRVSPIDEPANYLSGLVAL